MRQRLRIPGQDPDWKRIRRSLGAGPPRTPPVCLTAENGVE